MSDAVTDTRSQGVTVGVDIGGTFTDVVVLQEDGVLRTAKTASTPPDYSVGVLDGLDKLGIAGGEIGRFAHGTTAAINAILTKTGAPTGLLTTFGFRDVLEIRRGDRGDLFNYWWRPPPPLVSREHRLEVRERIGFDGAVVEPLDERDVLEAIEVLRARGITSVAICFLNSFVNGEHELLAKELVERTWPEVKVCTSFEIVPEILEFERTATCVANAYVGPAMVSYLGDLEDGLRERGYEREVLVMSSAGTVMPIEHAVEVPVATATSGIAAGAMAGAAIAKRTGRPHLLTLDIGGTSSDIALIWDGKPRLTTEWQIEFGVPIKLPAVDIHTIGAGGGSIASVDSGGVLAVGPASAGADPGPACYGRGGAAPTTTDAQVVLGRLDVEQWRALYGRPLDAAAAAAAIDRDVAGPLGIDRIAAAAAILDVTVNNLVEAIRLVSVERGYDPRDFALAALGGAGAMYAIEVARALEIPEVIVPPAPGVTSALGLLQVDLAVHAQRSALRLQGDVTPEWMGALFEEVEQEAVQKLAGAGYPGATVKRQVDLRYFGQSRYMTIDAPVGRWTTESIEDLVRSFNAEHEREYGYVMPPHISQVEFANVRAVASIPIEAPEATVVPELEESRQTRSVYFAGLGFVDAPLLRRGSLPKGATVEGPALVQQPDTTTIIHPGAVAEVADDGSLLIGVGVA